MPYTYPNQKVAVIHRDMPAKNEGDFLLIKNKNLYSAYKDLNATALAMYLYLAGNKEGFSLAFSPKAVYIEMGMPETTARDQIKKLIEKGYLVQKDPKSNIFDFYEKPVKKDETGTVK